MWLLTFAASQTRDHRPGLDARAMVRQLAVGARAIARTRRRLGARSVKQAVLASSRRPQRRLQLPNRVLHMARLIGQANLSRDP